MSKLLMAMVASVFALTAYAQTPAPAPAAAAPAPAATAPASKEASKDSMKPADGSKSTKHTTKKKKSSKKKPTTSGEQAPAK